MISEKLKFFREKFKLTGRELSHKINVSKATLYRYENGFASPSAAQITMLCEIFECTPNELFGVPSVHYGEIALSIAKTVDEMPKEEQQIIEYVADSIMHRILANKIAKKEVPRRGSY